jgi:toxin ParE1/3/4
VPRLGYSTAARADLGEIYRYIRAQSGSGVTALRFVGRLRQKCEELANASIRMGRLRPELRTDLRSQPFESYLIFFRYLNGGILEIVNILEGHRDVAAFYRRDPQ